jgi:hypothetical protein
MNNPVCRLAYTHDVAAGRLAVFRGASEAPISEFIRAERATQKKQPTGRVPSGHIENGPAAVRRLPDQSRIDSDMLLLSASPARTPCRRPILNRDDITGICKTAHLLFRMGK